MFCASLGNAKTVGTTLNNKLMREGEPITGRLTKAILKWQTFYNKEENKLKKPKLPAILHLLMKCWGNGQSI